MRKHFFNCWCRNPYGNFGFEELSCLVFLFILIFDFWCWGGGVEINFSFSHDFLVYTRSLCLREKKGEGGCFGEKRKGGVGFFFITSQFSYRILIEILDVRNIEYEKKKP